MKASAIVYDSLMIITFTVLTLVVFNAAPKTAKAVSEILAKTNAQSIASDLGSLISGIYAAPFNMKTKYCFPTEKHYKVTIHEKEIEVKVEEEDCKSEFCYGKEDLPIELESFSFSTSQLSDGCIWVENENGKIKFEVSS